MSIICSANGQKNTATINYELSIVWDTKPRTTPQNPLDCSWDWKRTPGLKPLKVYDNDDGDDDFNTDVRHLTSGIRSEECVFGRFRRCEKVIEGTCINLDSIAYYTPRLCGIACCFLTTNLYRILLYWILWAIVTMVLYYFTTILHSCGTIVLCVMCR
jgi:hypothetical protein